MFLKAKVEKERKIITLVLVIYDEIPPVISVPVAHNMHHCVGSSGVGISPSATIWSVACSPSTGEVVSPVIIEYTKTFISEKHILTMAFITVGIDTSRVYNK